MALSGPLLGWLQNSCGLLSSFQISIPSHYELGISSSTASWLLNSTGRSRNFQYHCWFNPHLVVCSWGGRVQFSSCSVHFVCVVLVAQNLTEVDSGRADYGYLAFGELSRFVYCLLQKVKRSSDLPVIEKWEAYMLPNHSCFGAIAEEHFLEGTRLLSSVEKVNNSFLRKEFRRDYRRFLEDFVSTILSRVAARSPIGQGLSCFCPEIVFGGDDYSAFHLFGQLLDGCLRLVGSGGRKWNLQKLNSTLLCVSSDRWKQAAIDLVRRSTACLPFAIRPVSVLGGICTNLVLVFFKKSSRCSHDLTRVLL